MFILSLLEQQETCEECEVADKKEGGGGTTSQ